ncbi:PfkB family carbohydrate kinase [Mycolicibacterium neoaurum]|uniref:PfkB family carbohydrate kinase n=1 Tax=Mycolicibacterium neoaurum TaxID=1795 RepID=UPI00248B6F7D|nr:PfkB family carbohydrate kinase [Mycolicibacterium neoaurum]WBP93275.1 PfkB family carbohydrate kinase [Mycolicibacterium neoaurum]WBS07050.1 PfkB family carbohydrate kinase [Mycolicibacterium neoaurum]
MRNAPLAERAPVGVFVGLATLDVIHRIVKPPAANEKVTARDQFVAAGGPAANAAVTFAALGGRAVLVTALGVDPVADLVRADLTAHGVRIVDSSEGERRPVPISAVSVLESTGERSVVSLDAVRSDVRAPDGLGDLIADADVVLLDGHHPRLAVAAAERATAHGTALVADAGRWKPVMADLIPHVTDMVCSNDFRVPDTETSASTATALRAHGVKTVVTTHGGDPIRWWSAGRSGSVAVPAVTAVDTLGAGDAFHGAYSYYRAGSGDLEQHLDNAARVAALRCSIVGPRAWLDLLPEDLIRKQER